MAGQSHNRTPPGRKNSPRRGSSTPATHAAPPAPAPAAGGADPAATRVVAIGASAGGLEAVTELLDHLPADTGLAFILVQHQSPQGPHLLPTLLAKHTDMPVLEALHGAQVIPNHFYINPPDSGLILETGAIQTYLRATSAEHPNYIDVLFESVAREKGAAAIGVLLSGLDRDGINGILKIQQAGGITIAQNSTARFNELPARAIASTAIDFVLPPAEIADELALLARMPALLKDTEAPEQPAFAPDYLQKVLSQVSQVTRVDFSRYKIKTIQRRLWRRMLLSRSTDPDAYFAQLKQDPQEAALLAGDFLINVTGFFREPDVFQALKDKVFPDLLKQHPADQPLRIWVPACATGEEAYSIGMAYLEFLEDMATNPRIQIFATDLSQATIDKARRGVYPETAMEGISAQRRKRFFTKADGGYQISQPVRNMCVFAVQNVLSDPPISHVDLISCCNLFIYLQEEAQKRVAKTFHYALNPRGYLVLGSAESIGFATDLFSLEDVKSRIYRKKFSPVELPTIPPSWPEAKVAVPQLQNMETLLSPLDRIKHDADRLVLAQFAPAGFLVNQDLDIIQFRGDTGPFLQPANDAPSFHLYKMVRQELQAALREVIDQARSSKAPARKDRLQLMVNGQLMLFSINIVPLLPSGPGSGDYFLLLFSPAASLPLQEGQDEAGHLTETADVQQLKNELTATQRYLQDLKEEHFAANEELRAAIEEAQSNNEELQSTIEELESTKEELQSNNEELNTINEELYAKNNELVRANDDLNNLLASINVAFIILDELGHIRRFSSCAKDIFNLIDSDIGRPLSDIKPNVEMPPLLPLIETALKQMEPQNLTVPDHQGKDYQLRIRPYKTGANRIEGVVLMVQEKC